MLKLDEEIPEHQSMATVSTHRPPSDVGFFLIFGVIAATYVAMILVVLLADTAFTSRSELLAVLRDPDIQYSIKLSLFSCTVTSLLSVMVAVPLGYLLSRHLMPQEQDRYADEQRHRRLRMWLGHLIDTIIDVPVVLPPLVIGLSLLILFRLRPFSYIDRYVTYEVPAVIIAQFFVASAFAVRMMRLTFDQIPPRHEQIAWTLGCSRGQAFWKVVLPASRRGILAAATMAWARALGEFGPILVFAGSTRGRTEVLSTTVFLELTIGQLEGAIAVSLLMVAAAVVVLIIMRILGLGVWG